MPYGLVEPTAWERRFVAFAAARLGVAPEPGWDAFPGTTGGPFDDLARAVADPLAAPPEAREAVLLIEADDPALEAIAAARAIRAWLDPVPEERWAERLADVLVLLPSSPGRRATWKRVLEAHGLAADAPVWRPVSDLPAGRWLVAVARLAGWGEAPGGRRIAIRGRVDRVDLAEDRPDAAIVDYKTGRAKGKAQLEAEIGDGVHLQLPLYARAVDALLAGRNGIPAKTRSVLGRLDFVRFRAPAQTMREEGSAAELVPAGPDGAPIPGGKGLPLQEIVAEHLGHALRRLEAGVLPPVPRSCPQTGGVPCPAQSVCGALEASLERIVPPEPQPRFVRRPRRPGEPKDELKQRVTYAPARAVADPAASGEALAAHEAGRAVSDPGLYALRHGHGLALRRVGADGFAAPRGRVDLSRLRLGFTFDAEAAVAALAPSGEGAEATRAALRADAERLAVFQAAWERADRRFGVVPPGVVLRGVVEDTGYGAVLHARPGGLQALANLRSFLALVDAVSEGCSPMAAIRELDRLAEAGDDPARAGSRRCPARP